MFKKKHFYNLLIVFIILIIPILWVIQKNSKIQNLIVSRLITFVKKECNLKISINKFDLNFFTGKILLLNGKIKSLDSENKNFQWSFDKAEISFSKLAYFIKNKFIFDVIFENLYAKSTIQNQEFAIKKHLQEVVFESSNLIKGKIKSCIIKNMKFKLIINDNDSLYFNFDGIFGFKKFKSFLSGKYWSGYCNIKKGNVYFNDEEYMKDLNGICFFSENNFLHKKFNIDVSFKSFSLNNYYGLSTNYFIKTKNFKDKKFVFLTTEKKDLNVKCDLNNYLHFYIKLQNLKIPYLNSIVSLVGKMKIDLENKELRVSLVNSLLLQNYFFLIKPQNLKLNFQINSNFKLNGNYNVVMDKKNDNDIEKTLNGSFFINKDIWKIYNKTGNYGNLILEGNFKPHFYITKALYESRGKKLINCLLRDLNNKTLFGRIDYSFIRSFIPIFIKQQLLGKQASLFFELDQKDFNFLKGSLFFKGRLSILQNYNPIEKARIDFSIDTIKKQIDLNNFYMSFYKGKIYSSKPYLNIKLFNKSLTYSVAAPLKIRNFLVNWNNNFYGILDGDLNINKGIKIDRLDEDYLEVSGDLTLKKTLIKGDLDVDGLQGENLKLFIISPFIKRKNNVINFDINLKNEDLIEIKTSTIDAKAICDFNIKTQYIDGTLCLPQVIGFVELEQGALKFLENDLLIDYAKIQFFPNEFSDPIIDLLAKNRIKKYLINLQATGSLHNPKIIFESFPELTKKEILSLLIVGSEQANLRSEISSLLMHGFSNFFDKKSILPKATSFFKRLTQPFKYVQITPNFINQSSQGLIKGEFNINLNNQIHAQIQKNFNLRDDLFFQFEYLLTDDINFKILKDQRGDIGAQIEFGFKL